MRRYKTDGERAASITRFLFLHLLVLPPTIVFCIALLGSGFSFEKLYGQYYGYVSEVSQSPAESPLHVNDLSCIRYGDAASGSLGDAALQVSCEEWELKSILISDVAGRASQVTLAIYLFLVMITMIIHGGLKVVFPPDLRPSDLEPMRFK